MGNFFSRPLRPKEGLLSFFGSAASAIGKLFGRPKEAKPVAPFLSEDIILEILSRAPKKYLLGFLEVSKGWQNLITSEIIALPVHGIIVQSDTPYYGVTRRYFAIPGDDFGREIHASVASSASSLWLASKAYCAIDICNGLFLYQDHVRGVCGVHYPARKRWQRLPPSWHPPFGHAGIVFDPQSSPDFLVIRLLLDPNSLGLLVDTYCSTNGWRVETEIRDVQVFGEILECRYAYIDDMMFIFFLCQDSPYTLIEFNFRHMTYRTMELPVAVVVADEFVTVEKCNEHLYYASLGNNLQIWSLETDGQEYGWNLLHTCTYNYLRQQSGFHLPVESDRIVLRFHTHSEVILLWDLDVGIFCYHWNTQRFMKVCNAVFNCQEIFPVSLRPFSVWTKPYWL